MTMKLWRRRYILYNDGNWKDSVREVINIHEMAGSQKPGLLISIVRKHDKSEAEAKLQPQVGQGHRSKFNSDVSFPQ